MFKQFTKKKKYILISSIMLLGLFFSYTFLSINSNLIISEFNHNKDNFFDDHSIYSSDLTYSENIIEYSGIGSAWNVTHFANTTKNNEELEFTNGSYDTTSIDLGTGWEGYELESSVYNLYDIKNWNNGTFHYGDDSGMTGDDDTNDIANNFQNWTFTADDNSATYTNTMSGNYNDNLLGQDALELRMNGQVSDTYYGYDSGDKCMWNTTFNINRGEIIDSELQFDVNPYHLTEFNSWDLIVKLNNEIIFSEGINTVRQRGEQQWHTINRPQIVWPNNNIFSGNANDTEMRLSISIEYTSTTARYSQSFYNIDYQQLFIDNVKLITKAEVIPSQINLKLNNKSVNDIDWGQGQVLLTPNQNWMGNEVLINITASHLWGFSDFSSSYLGVSSVSSYKTELTTDLTLETILDEPETNWKEDTESIGTSFTVQNNSDTNWLTYAALSIPLTYNEYNMRIEFPEDVNITKVFTPGDRTTNILSLCDNSTSGTIDIPVNDLTTSKSGFFKLEAKSPNYCSELTLLNNETGSWTENYAFYNGEYINITGNIRNSAVVSSYLDQTIAGLEILFPNGTTWVSQFKSVETNGRIYFDTIKVPETPPNYEFGEYKVSIYWNNSYASFGANETGVISKSFSVIHDSILKPEEGSYDAFYGGAYYFANVKDNTIKNIRFEYFDDQDNTAITEDIATVYTFISGELIYMPMVGEGVYLLEFNASSVPAGNNTIIIYGNASYHVNIEVNITVDVSKETILSLESDFLTSPFKQNFTVAFNYTEEFTANFVNLTSFQTDWQSGFFFLTQVGDGQYELICNTSAYEANIIKTFTITVDADKYEKQIATVRVQITELASNLTLYLNGNKTLDNGKLTIGIYQTINITVTYRDLSNNHLTGADVYVSGGIAKTDLDENSTLKQYSLLINGTDLGRSINSLNVFAKAPNYNLQIVPFVIEVVEEQSNLTVYLNRIDLTADPSIEIPVSQMLNITIKYDDLAGEPIPNATIELVGEGIDEILPYISALEHYSTILNTSEDLSIGVNLLTVVAQGINYQSQTSRIRATIRRINTEIISISGSNQIEIRPGDTIPLKIAINNTDFGGYLTNISVNYNWEFGKGSLSDANGDGVYEVVLDGVPDGAYTIIITAFAGDEYNIESYEITVSAVRPAGEIAAIQAGLIVSIIAAVILGSYLILYLTVLKYPKPVRKVRKFRRTLKRKEAPSVKVTKRDVAFKSKYNEELSNSSKFIKSRPKVDKLKAKKTVPSEPKEPQETPTEDLEDKEPETSSESDENTDKSEE